MIPLLPKIYYDLSVLGENPIPVVIPDVVFRLNMRINTAEMKVMLFDYEILDGETPEIVSHKLYNTMDHHWVLMCLNNRFDYISDWPIKYESMENFCAEKYGEDHVYDIHHYEDLNGNVVDEYYYDYKNELGQQPTGILAEEPIWKSQYRYSEQNTDVVQLKQLQGIAVTNFDYEDRLNEEKRYIKAIKPQFISQFVRTYEEALRASIE